ncbi:MAG: hypothetical protein EZS28_033304, partial [Streblomastix strix]
AKAAVKRSLYAETEVDKLKVVETELNKIKPLQTMLQSKLRKIQPSSSLPDIAQLKTVAQVKPLEPKNYTTQLSKPEAIQVDDDLFTNISGDSCTILFDPPIKSGIAWFEVLNVKMLWQIGIVDEDVKMVRDIKFGDKGSEKIACFQRLGKLHHYGDWIEGNSKFDDGDRVALELDLTSNPSTLTLFINNKEQKYYIISVPENAKFWCLLLGGEQIKVLKYEQLQTAKSQHKEGSVQWEFGTIWRKDKHT